MKPYLPATPNTGHSGFHPSAVAAAVMAALIMPSAAQAQIAAREVAGVMPTDVAATAAGASLSYTGGLSQLGIGIDRSSRISAQGSHILAEDGLSAVIAQGWLGGHAGGVRLDYNWIGEKDGKADTNVAVRKLFAAVDRNRDNDRKLTVGTGLEWERLFGALSISRALSGERNMGGPVVGESVATVSGIEGDRPYVDTFTTTTSTRFFQQAYDFGVGIRGGTFLPDAGMRVSVGFDREWGRFSSRQNTFSLGMEKYFHGSPHSFGLLIERYDRSGQYETTSGHGTRALLTYRYSFGGSAYASAAGWREARSVRQVEVPSVTEVHEARQSAAPVVQMRKETRIVKTTASMASDAFFDFDKTELTPVARRELDRIAGILKMTERAGNVHVVGHTCDIGSDAYNLRLSRRRANAVRDYLVSAGLPADAFVTEGKGESEPKYPNKRDTRAKNRRVDLEFVQYRDKTEEIEVPVEMVTPVPTTKPPVTWREEVIDREPAWVRRALRNTVPHKQTVDTYRGAEISKATTTSRTWTNRAPVLRDDSFTVQQGVTATLDVLANDSDPDGNALAIVAVGAAVHGMVAIAGNTLQYAPAAGYVGGDSFTYTVDDGHGGRVTASVQVNVLRANHAPIAVDDRFVVGNRGNWPLDVLANDSDADGDALSIVSFTQPQPSTVGTVVRDGNRLVFQSQSSFQTATFTYVVSDGHGGTATGTVTLVDP